MIHNGVPTQLIKQKEETNQLIIVLQDLDYTTQAPLLYYTTGLFYNIRLYVLHINYKFSKEEWLALQELNLARDIQMAIENAIKDKEYSNYYIVAKSIKK